MHTDQDEIVKSHPLSGFGSGGNTNSKPLISPQATDS
jgi:hypothetical protein